MGKARGRALPARITRTGKENLAQSRYEILLTESALGECLAAQNRFSDAEPLIIGSCENLKATQGEKNPDTIAAAKRAAELYEKWNKPQLAARYRALLAASAPTH